MRRAILPLLAAVLLAGGAATPPIRAGVTARPAALAISHTIVRSSYSRLGAWGSATPGARLVLQ